MGTVVFPDADVKIYLDASVEERARRRFKQLKENGKDVTLDRLMSDLELRDRRDREREVSPTVPAADAHLVDSTSMTLDDVVQKVLDVVGRKLPASGS